MRAWLQQPQSLAEQPQSLAQQELWCQQYHHPRNAATDVAANAKCGRTPKNPARFRSEHATLGQHSIRHSCLCYCLWFVLRVGLRNESDHRPKLHTRALLDGLRFEFCCHRASIRRCGSVLAHLGNPPHLLNCLMLALIRMLYFVHHCIHLYSCHHRPTALSLSYTVLHLRIYTQNFTYCRGYRRERIFLMSEPIPVSKDELS